MSSVMFRLPKEAQRCPARSYSLSPPTKQSRGNLSSPPPFALPSGEKAAIRRNSSSGRRPDSRIKTSPNRSKARKSDSRDLVMEEVKILKRGEVVRPLSRTSSADCIVENPTPCLMGRLGPDPMALPKPSGKAYAGPAFISSPSPNSLPLPFFLKKAVSRGEDVATRSLMCLLRLDASL